MAVESFFETLKGKLLWWKYHLLWLRIGIDVVQRVFSAETNSFVYLILIIRRKGDLYSYIVAFLKCWKLVRMIYLNDFSQEYLVDSLDKLEILLKSVF